MSSCKKCQAEIPGIIALKCGQCGAGFSDIKQGMAGWIAGGGLVVFAVVVIALAA